MTPTLFDFHQAFWTETWAILATFLYSIILPPRLASLVPHCEQPHFLPGPWPALSHAPELEFIVLTSSCTFCVGSFHPGLSHKNSAPSMHGLDLFSGPHVSERLISGGDVISGVNAFVNASLT
ncbi:uncharacterized protein BJX67DRAFT_11228 [Aspergillus lucknowensis]|uniref:Uncharacterized protein n=1 Tax=Aspergillus lucknowensis TaxID=176173 RepID=A0ABR4M7G3_9EURO